MADNKKREPSAPKGISMLGMLHESQQAGKPTVAMPEQEQTSPVQEPAVSDGELWNKFLENMIKYTGVKEQGSAVWIPSDVKKRLDDFRATAKRNIPIRTLVSAIVVAFLDENEAKLKDL